MLKKLKYWLLRNTTYRHTKVKMELDQRWETEVGQITIGMHGFTYIYLGRNWYEPTTTEEAFFNAHIYTDGIPKIVSWSDDDDLIFSCHGRIYQTLPTTIIPI
jgi:hypothetical protein